MPAIRLPCASSRRNSRREWIFRGFYPSSSSKLRGIARLPDKPTFYGKLEMYHPEWDVRIHYQHILQDNRDRLPSSVRELNILPLLLKTSVMYGRELAFKIVHTRINARAFHFFLCCRAIVIFSAVNLGHCPSSNKLHWMKAIDLLSMSLGISFSIRSNNLPMVALYFAVFRKLSYQRR